MSTAKEICEGVPILLLDSLITDIHLSDIASRINEWREMAPYLDLSEIAEKDIVDSYPNHPELQRREALRKWRESNGNKATYRRLIHILCSQCRARTAQSLKQLLMQTTKNTSTCIDQDLEKFHEYVKDCYLNLKHPSSLQWPFSSNQNYVELDLYDAPLMKGSDSLKAIALKSIFSDTDQSVTRKVVLIEGVAGSGKTTLCWYICTKWAAGKLFEDVKVLIHISFSDTSIHSATELADLIPHPSEDMRKAVARAIADVRGKGICFLLDACDEAPVAFKGSFLFRFIAGTERKATIPYASILLTSRPGLPYKLLNCLTRKIIIKGFQSLDKFIEVTVPANDKKRIQLLEALEMKPVLKSLCHIPLHAVILVHLFDCFKDNLPTTRTGLFHPLVCNFLIRHVGNRTEYPLDSVFDLSNDLPQDVYSSFRSISEIAYKSLVDGMPLKISLKSAGMIPLWEEKFGFFRTCERIAITTYGPTEVYKFSHLSLQEFLAAFYITQLKEPNQAVAFRQIYKQNPLSPALSFYAGLTELRSEEICNLLFLVVEKPFDLTSTVQQLEKKGNIANDKRRQLLSLMNCIYETQQAALVNRVLLKPIDSILQQRDKIVASSDVAAYSIEKVEDFVEIPLAFIMLYTNDCLSIGYYARHACSSEQNLFDILFLNLAKSPLRSLEIKALCQELCQPAQEHKLSLNMTYIRLADEALNSIKTVLNSQSALNGLAISGDLIENVHLALKYIIEGISSNPHWRFLGLIDIPLPVAHHLILLFYCCRFSTLDLSGSKGLFANPKVMILLCEALKNNSRTIYRLLLDSCNIDDHRLILLANALINGCKIWVLDLGWNSYTSNGLKEFLSTLVKGVNFTDLLVLSTSIVSNSEHRLLVDKFNNIRQQFNPSYGKLKVECKNTLCSRDDLAKDAEFFIKRPQYTERTPHD